MLVSTLVKEVKFKLGYFRGLVFPSLSLKGLWSTIDFCLCPLQQPWSSRNQQILVPAWQQVAPPPTTMASDTAGGPQRLSDWG